MAFKKAATTTATAAVADESTVAAADKVNLGDLIDRLGLELEGVLTKTRELKDSELTDDYQPIADGLAQVAKLIGFDDYSADMSSLVFVVTQQGNRYLARPSVYAYEDGLCVRWGDKTFPLAAEQALGTDMFVLVPGDDPLLLIDPSGYCLTCPVKLDGIYRGEQYKGQMASKLATCRTAGALAEYLLRGEKLISWGDINEEDTIELFNIQWSPSRKDPSRQTGIMLATRNGEAIRLWCPAEINEWMAAGIPLAETIGEGVAAVKSGKQVTIGESTFELKGGNFAKLAELEQGKEYKVVGYTSEQVTYNGSTWVDWKLSVIVDGTEKTVSGNAYLKNLLSKTEPVITPETPALLHVDAVTETKDGKKRVQCRLVPQSAKENPLLAKLRAQQAERAAAGEAPVPAL